MSLSYNLSLEPTELIQSALNWLNEGYRVAMITLVNIEGNAPYPVGSQMLVNDQGAYLGQITGGCAEVAIADQAVLAINDKQNLTLRYGLDSPFFDIQLPCGSGIDVYFDCDIKKQQISQIAAQLEARTVYRQALQTGLGVFTKIYAPSPRLMLVGQGPILVLLAELAMKSGFDVACVAQNEHTENLLHRAKLEAVGLDKIGGDFVLELDSFSAMVSLFHEHHLELPLLAKALKTQAFFVGALGSKRTQQARLDGLKEMATDELLLARVRGPVGLNIGANTPAQIAVSILAELIQQLNQADK